MSEIIPKENIEHKIYFIRAQKVMLDRDLALLYGAKAIRLREQVKRNIRRFPKDFMFQLSNQECNFMVSQNAIPSKQHLGGHNPYVFTEQGVAMLSTVLHSDRAIEVNIAIMRAFVKLRKILSTHRDLAQKVKKLEQKVGQHDQTIQAVFDAIKRLMDSPEEKKKGRIGFHKS